MKKVLCLIMVTTLLFLGACSNTIPHTDLVYGIYCPEGATATFPKLYLKDDGNFSFNYKSMGAGVDKGTFEVEDNILTLHCTNDNVFTFEIAEDYIVFDADKSSEIVQEDTATPIVDGTKFLIRHEANR